MQLAIRYRCLFAVLALGATLATVQADEHKSPVAEIELQDGDRLVFLGNSITHQRLYTQYVEDFFYTRFPERRVKFHNAGVGGATAWDALQRFERDVAAYQPKYVTVLLGMNDGRYRSFNEEVWKTYRDDMTALIKRIEKIDAVPILITPTMYDARASLARKRKPAENYNAVLSFFGTWLREVAVENGYGFVDMWGPLNKLTFRQRKTDPDFTMIKDAVHPGPAGQVVMAYAIIDDMGLGQEVSFIHGLRMPDGQVRVNATGGKVSDVHSDANSVTFTWTASSLPWVVPSEAELGVELLNLGHHASRESLEFHGLNPGDYELSIDDQIVGTYSHLQLARHIELQDNPRTPQHQQALQVAELNKKRNVGPIGQLRGEWSRFQRFARLQRQSKNSPDNADLAAQLVKAKEAMEGMESRIASHEEAARNIENEIYRVNQPKPRRYVLRQIEP